MSSKIRPIMATYSGAINTQLGYHRPFDTLYVDFNSETKGSGLSWDDPLNSLSDIFNEKIHCICLASCCNPINVYCRGESPVGIYNEKSLGFQNKLIVHNLSIHVDTPVPDGTPPSDEYNNDNNTGVFSPGYDIIFKNFSFVIDNFSGTTLDNIHYLFICGFLRSNTYFNYNIDIRCDDPVISEDFSVSSRLDYVIYLRGTFHKGTFSLHLKPASGSPLIEEMTSGDKFITRYSLEKGTVRFEADIYDSSINCYYDFSNCSFNNDTYYPGFIDLSSVKLYNTDFFFTVISNGLFKIDGYNRIGSCTIGAYIRTSQRTFLIDSSMHIDYGEIEPVPAAYTVIYLHLEELYGYYSNSTVNIISPIFNGTYIEDALYSVEYSHTYIDSAFRVDAVELYGEWNNSRLNVTYKPYFGPSKGLNAKKIDDTTFHSATEGSSVRFGMFYVKMSNVSKDTIVTLNYPSHLDSGDGGDGLSYVSSGETFYIGSASGGGFGYNAARESPVIINGGNAGRNPYPNSSDPDYDKYGGCGGDGSCITHYYNNITVVSGRNGSSSLSYECDVRDCEEYNIYDYVTVPEGVTVVVNYLE